MFDSLPPHGLQHSRPSCPSSTPRVHLNTRPLSQWCHPTNLSSVVPFSSCAWSFQESGSFQMSQLFASGGQSIGVSLQHQSHISPSPNSSNSVLHFSKTVYCSLFFYSPLSFMLHNLYSSIFKFIDSFCCQLKSTTESLYSLFSFKSSLTWLAFLFSASSHSLFAPLFSLHYLQLCVYLIVQGFPFSDWVFEGKDFPTLLCILIVQRSFQVRKKKKQKTSAC